MRNYLWHTCTCITDRGEDGPFPDRCIFDEPRDSLITGRTVVRSTLTGECCVLVDFNNDPHSSVVRVQWSDLPNPSPHNGHYLTLV